MHAHMTIMEYGQFIGVRSECLTVKENDTVKEYPLNRLKSIQVAKRGVSFSADVVLACANRGIKFFLCDFRNEIVACLAGAHQHAVVRVRQKQFEFLSGEQVARLAAMVIAGKIKNQRATLLYFKKYHRDKAEIIDAAAESLKLIAREIATKPWPNYARWTDILLGLEGRAAAQYWRCLMAADLLSGDFDGRVGRRARDLGNQCLNFGYAILATYVWNALINAGLEPYAGFFHTPRAGKPSLVLDMMEEYRAWVVDRNVIKRRGELRGKSELTAAIKRRLIADIHKTFTTKYYYHRRKMRLESILQRQTYHLAGVFSGDRQYKNYRFRW